VLSHTEGLIRLALKVFESAGASREIVRPVGYEILAGLGTDMSTTPEWGRDDWPTIQAKIDDRDILLLCTSVWLGEKTSASNRVLEWMYGYTHLVNARGQHRDCGKVGVALITGRRRHQALRNEHPLSHIGSLYPPSPGRCRLGG